MCVTQGGPGQYLTEELESFSHRYWQLTNEMGHVATGWSGSADFDFMTMNPRGTDILAYNATALNGASDQVYQAWVNETVHALGGAQKLAGYTTAATALDMAYLINVTRRSPTQGLFFEAHSYGTQLIDSFSLQFPHYTYACANSSPACPRAPHRPAWLSICVAVRECAADSMLCSTALLDLLRLPIGKQMKKWLGAIFSRIAVPIPSAGSTFHLV